jgi:lipid-A-disaccharide synthase-like uncharacterized protein
MFLEQEPGPGGPFFICAHQILVHFDVYAQSLFSLNHAAVAVFMDPNFNKRIKLCEGEIVLDVWMGRIECGSLYWLVALKLCTACFFSRFLVQWIASERQGKSTVPILFWYLSIIGGTLVLVYAIWLKEPVFTLGQSVGLIVYVRNLWLIRKEKRHLKVNSVQVL